MLKAVYLKKGKVILQSQYFLKCALLFLKVTVKIVFDL